MEGEESLQKFSPQVMIKESFARSAISLLPRIILFHGTSDHSIPSTERCVKLLFAMYGKPFHVLFHDTVNW